MKVCKFENFTYMLNILRALKMSGLGLFPPRLLARKRPRKIKDEKLEKEDNQIIQVSLLILNKCKLTRVGEC